MQTNKQQKKKKKTKAGNDQPASPRIHHLKIGATGENRVKESSLGWDAGKAIPISRRLIVILLRCRPTLIQR